MSARNSDQTMKPETAAKKLAIYLPAAPEEFRSNPITRSQLTAIMADPPEWLRELRKTGPHPRQEVARKLGVSVSGLARGEITEPLTTEQISALLQERPEWLVNERAVHAGVQSENARVKAKRAEKAREVR